MGDTRLWTRQSNHGAHASARQQRIEHWQAYAIGNR
jgi:hypothetical protein